MLNPMRMRVTHCAVVLSACLFVASCEQNPQAFSRKTSDQQPTTSQLLIKSVDIMASSKKLEEWKDFGGPNQSRLPVFDVVVMGQNRSDSSIQDADLIALTTIEFVIAPTYLHQGDVNKILKDASWSRLVAVNDVKMETVPYVKPGEDLELRITGFNLSDLLAAYKGQDDTLWPWALKVSVHFLNREMRRVALGQTTLRMIPADSRLRAK